MNKKYENNIRRLAKQHNINEEELIEFYSQDKALDIESLPMTKRGQVGELYVQYYLARKGIQFAIPNLLEQALDLIVLGNSGKAYKCEIKSSLSHNITINRAHYSNKKFEQHRYTKDEVDFFILCTLNNNNVFIVPYEEYEIHSKCINCTPVSFVWKYKDAVEQFI